MAHLVLDRLAHIWLAWLAACNMRNPQLVKAREQSWLKRPTVQMCFEALAGVDFKSVPESVSGYLRIAFAAGTTKVIEDGCQRLRA